LGHGSNIRDILTTAEYDMEKREFILNSNGDLGAKWWIGAAAELATVSVIWA
jgi:acyl-CoA oxidase